MGKKQLLWNMTIGLCMTVQSAFALTLSSSAFMHNGAIPKIYTCDGEDQVPALSWSGAPEGTKSYALIVDDPDAPSKTWVHWLVYNIPASATGIDAETSTRYPMGLNDFGKKTYGGPCPPSGTHHYHFTLYALDASLELSGTPTKKQLVDAMKGHIVAQATLIGTYERGKR